MRKCLLLFILTTFTQVVFAQFLDNFSDGEFTNNLIWSGNVGVFEVDTTFKLHLNDTISGESFLATESNVFTEDGIIERFKQVVVLSR